MVPCIASITSHKGGIGKTTITVNLAHCVALARREEDRRKRVLVVDNDPQGNATQLLLGSRYDGDTICNIYDSESVDVRRCIVATPYDNVFCLPNSPNTALIERDLWNRPGAPYVLRDALRKYALENYDLTLIDNPPNMGIFVYQSLLCSDFCIVPVESGSRFALDGLVHALELIEEIKKEANKDLRFLRLLINKVDLRTGMSKSSVEVIRDSFGRENAFKTTLPVNTQLVQAESEQLTIIRHNPRCSSAKAFKRLADEFLSLLEAA